MIITIFCLLWILYLLFDYQFCLLYLCFHLWVIWGTALSMNVCKIFITSVNFTMLCKITGMFHHVLQVYHSISPCYARLLIFHHFLQCLNLVPIPSDKTYYWWGLEFSLLHSLSEKAIRETGRLHRLHFDPRSGTFKSNWTVEDNARGFHISFCFNLSTMMNKQVFWGGSFRGFQRVRGGFQVSKEF